MINCKESLRQLIESNNIFTPLSAKELQVGSLCNIYGKCQMIMPETDSIFGMYFYMALQCDNDYPNSDNKSVAYIELDRTNLIYNYVLHDAYTELAGKRMMFFGKVISIKNVKGTIIPVIGDVVLTKILTGCEGSCSDGRFSDIENI